MHAITTKGRVNVNIAHRTIADEEKIDELTIKFHNIFYVLRSLGSIMENYNNEIQRLAKKNMSLRRSTNVTSILRWYNSAMQALKTAWTFQTDVYQDSELLDEVDCDSFEVLQQVLQASLNVDLAGNDYHEKLVVLLPKSIYPKFLTWWKRYNNQIPLEYLGTTEERIKQNIKKDENKN